MLRSLLALGLPASGVRSLARQMQSPAEMYPSEDRTLPSARRPRRRVGKSAAMRGVLVASGILVGLAAGFGIGVAAKAGHGRQEASAMHAAIGGVTNVY